MTALETLLLLAVLCVAACYLKNETETECNDYPSFI